MEQTVTSYPEPSPAEIESIKPYKTIRIKRTFFTFDYLGHAIDQPNNAFLFEFRAIEKGFEFSGNDFSGKWCRDVPGDDWTEALPGRLYDQFGGEEATAHIVERNETRNKTTVVRDLFRIHVQENTYNLWCVAELNWLSENAHKLLLLSDEKGRIIIRGRTESLIRKFHLLHEHPDMRFLIPIYFVYYMHPPISCG